MTLVQIVESSVTTPFVWWLQMMWGVVKVVSLHHMSMTLPQVRNLLHS